MLDKKVELGPTNNDKMYVCRTFGTEVVKTVSFNTESGPQKMMTKYEYLEDKTAEKVILARMCANTNTHKVDLSKEDGLQFLRSLYFPHQTPEYQKCRFTLIAVPSSRSCLSDRRSPIP